ncbi:hypothetical protein, partial [Halomonas sp. AOP42-E1-30]|uniref:hypothetical protein n=1 Tax=Halomonas sp. AOP42-E1-30 TaxID=3457665 RepID=UPI004034A072
AQGLQLGLRLPVSWVADEGRRPHIVQKWRNLGGYGHTTIMLDIRDTGGEVSDTEVLNFVESGEVRYFIPEGAEFLQASVTQIDAKTAYSLDYIYRQNIGDKIILLQARQYQLFFDGMAIGIQCQTISGVGQGPLDFVSEEDARIFISEESEKQSGVCQQVAHSLVLYQAW